MVIKELCDILDELYPSELAWDNDLPRIGFILGDKNRKLENVLLTLDINLDVIDEAINKNCNFIIAHHPLIFYPIYKIDFDTSLGKIIKKLIENNISVYSMHTNLDVGVEGVADTLAERISLKNITGENEKDSYMRIGEIKETKFKDLFNKIKDNLDITGLRYAGDEEKLIKRIAIFGGSGGNERAVMEAVQKNADLYISSEFKLSAVQLAVNNNLCVIEVNHGVEKLVFINLLNKLNKFVNTKIYISEVDTDPFRYYK